MTSTDTEFNKDNINNVAQIRNKFNLQVTTNNSSDILASLLPLNLNTDLQKPVCSKLYASESNDIHSKINTSEHESIIDALKDLNIISDILLDSEPPEHSVHYKKPHVTIEGGFGNKKRSYHMPNYASYCHGISKLFFLNKMQHKLLCKLYILMNMLKCTKNKLCMILQKQKWLLSGGMKQLYHGKGGHHSSHISKFVDVAYPLARKGDQSTVADELSLLLAHTKFPTRYILNLHSQPKGIHNDYVDWSHPYNTSPGVFSKHRVLTKGMGSASFNSSISKYIKNCVSQQKQIKLKFTKN